MAYTTIKTKQGQEYTFLTQQYQVGLYVIINGDPATQEALQIKEKVYHHRLRKIADEEGDTWTGTKEL